MIALVAVASTAVDASNYFPQQGKETKSQTIKAKKPMKKVARIKAVPIQEAKVKSKK